MKKIAILSMTLFAFAACKKEDTSPQTITYNIAIGAWSTQPTNYTLKYAVNGDTSTYTNLSSNFREEVGPVKEDAPYYLRVINNTSGTIGGDIYIQKCIDGQCGDFIPVDQQHSVGGVITVQGEVKDPDQ